LQANTLFSEYLDADLVFLVDNIGIRVRGPLGRKKISARIEEIVVVPNHNKKHIYISRLEHS